MSTPEKPPEKPPGEPPGQKAEGPHPRLKARPGLFKMLCVAYALWMAALLAMYFWTVYPLRHAGGP
ncbi:MAG: hypothetical protein ABSB74_08335 [Tepidisphaeraceae bacterium]